MSRKSSRVLVDMLVGEGMDLKGMPKEVEEKLKEWQIMQVDR
jgi:hypothetical protein